MFAGVFYYYYLNLIKQLIAGPYVPFTQFILEVRSTTYVFILFYLMAVQQSSLTGLKALCPSLHHLVSNIERTQETYLFTDALTEELINWSPCQPVFYLFIWPLFEKPSSVC